MTDPLKAFADAVHPESALTPLKAQKPWHGSVGKIVTVAADGSVTLYLNGNTTTAVPAAVLRGVTVAVGDRVEVLDANGRQVVIGSLASTPGTPSGRAISTAGTVTPTPAAAPGAVFSTSVMLHGGMTVAPGGLVVPAPGPYRLTATALVNMGAGSSANFGPQLFHQGSSIKAGPVVAAVFASLTLWYGQTDSTLVDCDAGDTLGALFVYLSGPTGFGWSIDLTAEAIT